jgi:hypothetical protein
MKALFASAANYWLLHRMHGRFGKRTLIASVVIAIILTLV